MTVNFFDKNVFLRKVTILTLTVFSTLGFASACSLPGTVSTPKTVATFGVLKKDPAVREDGLFVRANTEKNIKGDLNGQGLSGLSVLKMQQYNKDILFALTRERGLFKSEDGGVAWQRVYIYKVNDDNDKNGISKNDSIVISDFSVDITQDKVIYASANDGGIGRIFQSFDGGQNFKEVYKEVENGVNVIAVIVDPINNLRVYGLLSKGALIRSLDGGLTWQKIRNFSEVPTQIGFVPEFNGLFYALFAKAGLAISKDSGETWQNKTLTKEASKIGESQPKDGLDINFINSSLFGTLERLVPVTAGISYDYSAKKVVNEKNTQSWVLIADRQIWYTEDLNVGFKKMVLPLQSQQYNIADVAVDPTNGLSKIYVSIDNQLFVSRNKGESWNNQNIIGFSGQIGNISQILIDKNNPDIMYLGLLNKNAKKNGGLFVF